MQIFKKKKWGVANYTSKWPVFCIFVGYNKPGLTGIDGQSDLCVSMQGLVRVPYNLNAQKTKGENNFALAA